RAQVQSTAQSNEHNAQSCSTPAETGENGKARQPNQHRHQSAHSELGWCDPHLRPARLRADNCSINRNAHNPENEQPARQNRRARLMQLMNDASRMLQQVFQEADWVFCVRHWLEDEIVGEQWWLF